MFVDPIRWDLAATDEQLAAGESVALGFDGSKYRDATALIASRMSDGHLFPLHVWERPTGMFGEEWRVPSAEVDRVVRDAFGAYAVTMLFADPYRWQDYLDNWAAAFPDRVVEFPTNVEQRMDRAIERFTSAFGRGEIRHDGSPFLARHMKNAVLVKGQRKKIRPGEDETLAQHYMKMAKRGPGQLIDASVAAVLAHEARAHAIEHGALNVTAPAEPLVVWR